MIQTSSIQVCRIDSVRPWHARPDRLTPTDGIGERSLCFAFAQAMDAHDGAQQFLPMPFLQGRRRPFDRAVGTERFHEGDWLIQSQIITYPKHNRWNWHIHQYLGGRDGRDTCYLDSHSQHKLQADQLGLKKCLNSGFLRTWLDSVPGTESTCRRYKFADLLMSDSGDKGTHPI